MLFAKICRFFIACSLMISINACTTINADETINREEALKARVNLALAYLAQGDFAKAKENIDRANVHNPNHYLPYSVQGYYFQQIGEFQNAEESYQTALKLSQNRPDVLNNYGAFLCQQQMFEQAYIIFELALASHQPYYFESDTLNNIIQCAKQEGNTEKLQHYLPKWEKFNQEK